MLIFWSTCLLVVTEKQETAGILRCNATLWWVWSEIWEVPQKCQLFYYCSEKREPRKKKKPVRQRRNLTTSVSLKSPIIAWEKGNQSKKHLTCSVRRDYSVWDRLCQLWFRLSLNAGTKLWIRMKEKTFPKSFSAEKAKTRLFQLKENARDDRKYEFLAVWPSLFRLAWKLLLCYDAEALENLWQPESLSDVIAGWAG